MMPKHPEFYVSLLVFLCGLFFIPAVFSAERYIVDSEQSFVRIAAKMCEPDLLKGEFGRISGEIVLDEKNLENSSVVITVTAADAVFDHEFHRTDNIKDIVLGEKILNVLKFPLITFKSTEIIRTNADQFQAYGEQSSVITAIVKGNMTLVGMTHPFEMEVTFHDKTGLTSEGRMVAAFSTFGTFKRSDFGVNYGLDRIGIRRMGDEVMVMTSITANRAE
jgi:polyisoprenoid-binding protein YceI